MIVLTPPNCENPIIISNFPTSENADYLVVCNFTPVIIENNIKTSTNAQAYLFINDNHAQGNKTWHKNTRFSTDKNYFCAGTKVYDLQGNEKIGYFGHYQKSVSKVSVVLWNCSYGFIAITIVLFIICAIKRPHIEGEMTWWQEFIFIFCIALLLLFYGIMAIIFLSR